MQAGLQRSLLRLALRGFPAGEVWGNSWQISQLTINICRFKPAALLTGWFGGGEVDVEPLGGVK